MKTRDINKLVIDGTISDPKVLGRLFYELLERTIQLEKMIMEHNRLIVHLTKVMSDVTVVQQGMNKWYHAMAEKMGIDTKQMSDVSSESLEEKRHTSSIIMP